MTIRTLQKASLATCLVLIAGLSATGVYATQENAPLESSLHQSSALRREQWGLKMPMQLTVNMWAASDPNSLHALAIKGDKDTAIKLLGTDDGWAQINQKTADDAQKTPLHSAVGNGHTNMVRLLLTCGADVNATNQYASTPLHFAAQQIYVDEIWLLLKYNADINATDFQGNTALHRLATSKRGHSFLSFTAVAQLLLSYGADITTRNFDGKTPLDCALGNRRKAMLERLNRERTQALRTFSETLQEQHSLPADVVRHLLTFALTEKQRKRLMHLDQE